jgi:hypothetical protein
VTLCQLLSLYLPVTRMRRVWWEWALCHQPQVAKKNLPYFSMAIRQIVSRMDHAYSAAVRILVAAEALRLLCLDSSSSLRALPIVLSQYDWTTKGVKLRTRGPVPISGTHIQMRSIVWGHNLD